MTFRNPGTGNEYYHGQCGFLRGERLLMAAMGRRRGDGDGQAPEPKRHRSVAFAEDENYEATPVTAKHNLRNSGQEMYVRTTAKCYDRVEEDIVLPDGGCEMQQRIKIRPATQSCKNTQLRGGPTTYRLATQLVTQRAH